MKFVCFGEILARFNPTGYGRFVQAHEMEVSYGGGEANVAVSLANFGKETAFVTKLPANDLTKTALRALKAHDVDVSNVVFGGDRMGIYFIEKGAAQRPSKVIYDRKYSSISMAQKEDFDWKTIFADAEWFHFTGITPALSDSCAEICLDACRTAKELGVTVSCDINFRKNLWSSEKANQIMSTLMPYVDVAIANEEDCEKMFGIEAENSDVTDGTLPIDGYCEVARQLSEKFNIPTVAISLRESHSASDNDLSAMLYNHGEYFVSKKYPIHIVDRVGSGDSFGGGLIWALSEGMDNQSAIEFAVAAAALKHTIENDFNEVTVAEVKALMSGDGSGRVQR